jgi:hypothetical protein
LGNSQVSPIALRGGGVPSTHVCDADEQLLDSHCIGFSQVSLIPFQPLHLDCALQKVEAHSEPDMQGVPFVPNALTVMLSDARIARICRIL